MRDDITYRVKRIQHAAESEDHKYVARIETGNPLYKYRYFYSQQEYQAYLNGLKPQPIPAVTPVTQQPDKIESPTKKTNPVIEAWRSFTNATENAIDNGKKYVDGFIKDTKNAAINGVDKIEDLVSSGKEAFKAITRSETAAREVDKKVNNSYTVWDTIKSFPSNIIKGMMGDPLTMYDKISDVDDIPQKIDKYNKEEDQAVTNPDYDPNKYAYSMNCAFCTATYDMRKRGYDVEAAPANSFTHNDLSEITSWYEGDPEVSSVDVAANLYYDKEGNLLSEKQQQKQTEKTAKAIEKHLKKNGNGSYGHFLVYWNEGGGHSMVWEVQKGEVVIRDCQTNTVGKVEDYLPYISSVNMFRSDNLEISDDMLKAVRKRL